MDTLTDVDATALRELVSRPGRVASVYFDLRATGEEEAWPRWRPLADRLARQGADEVTVFRLADRLLRAVPGPGVRAAFADGGELLLVRDIPGSDQRDLATYADLPLVLPLLAWLQERPAFVTALVDRIGADVTVHPQGSTRAFGRVITGPDDEIERNAPGGWAQGRYQHRAEDSWEHNAARVADALARTLHHYDARLLLLAGDVRALQYLEEHLPSRVKDEVVVRHVSGGRSPDGSWQRRTEQVADEVRLAVAHETASLLAETDEENRPGGRAVVGARATLDALAQGRVQTLLIAPDEVDAQTAWYGPGAKDVSDSRETLVRAGVPAVQGRLVDVAVRAALLTSAEIRILPPDVADAPLGGIGALCRFA